MRQSSWSSEAALTTTVLVHFGVSLIHGVAHTRADIRLPVPSMVFVAVVILIGPIAGLITQRRVSWRAGSWLIAATMAGALVFGLVNHFLIPGGDHVSHVKGPWSAAFGVTAAVLAITELAGTVLAVRRAVETRTV